MAAEFVDGMKEGSEYTASLKSAKRSLDANALYWKFCGKLATALREPPESIYRRHIRDLGNFHVVAMKTEAVPEFVKNWVSNHTGRFVETRKSNMRGFTTVLVYYGSSDFDKAQMSQLIDNCLQDCKAVGIDTSSERELSLIREELKR